MPSASDWKPYTSEKTTRTTAPAKKPTPTPAFFTDERSSSLASSISLCTSVDRWADASDTSWPMLGSASAVAGAGGGRAPLGVGFGGGVVLAVPCRLLRRWASGSSAYRSRESLQQPQPAA